ncbi:uncharacterized protein [Glycine max]|uniref:uncharacterized protein n=1 Tax=Glycine max TaxID=3847 RepID=UPI0003DE82A9|nr:uncharacterized protein LOC102662166 [Glycine max]|eukprot:XP_006606884.1 uncharacterized protein LOC102662166 [Glycine max]
MEIWNMLRDMFQDNKNSRVVTLEQEFSRTNMEDFSNASMYCQQLKELFNQLKNVGALVSNNYLVLQMVVGLTETYNGVATLIFQSDPLPPFYQACFMLTLEEVGFTKKVATDGGAAMVAHDTDDSHSLSKNSHQNRNTHRGKKDQNRNNNGKNNGSNHGDVKSNDGGVAIVAGSSNRGTSSGLPDNGSGHGCLSLFHLSHTPYPTTHLPSH